MVEKRFPHQHTLAHRRASTFTSRFPFSAAWSAYAHACAVHVELVDFVHAYKYTRY